MIHNMTFYFNNAGVRITVQQYTTWNFLMVNSDISGTEFSVSTANTSSSPNSLKVTSTNRGKNIGCFGFFTDPSIGAYSPNIYMPQFYFESRNNKYVLEVVDCITKKQIYYNNVISINGTVTFQVDTTPPSTSVTLLPYNSTLGNTIQYATATDGSWNNLGTGQTFNETTQLYMRYNLPVSVTGTNTQSVTMNGTTYPTLPITATLQTAPDLSVNITGNPDKEITINYNGTTVPVITDT